MLRRSFLPRGSDARQQFLAALLRLLRSPATDFCGRYSDRRLARERLALYFLSNVLHSGCSGQNQVIGDSIPSIPCNRRAYDNACIR